MRKVATMVMLLCLAMPVVHGITQGPEAVEEWFQKLSYKKEKVTKLHFFFHDIVSGKNPSAVKVAQANMTFKSPTLFGLITMADDPLTIGPDPNSTIVGRAQGIYASSALEELAFLMTMNVVFTSGKFNGSTLSILGQNKALETYREMAIVGGSGVFRLARGIATAKTHTINLNSGDAIVEYHVIVIHY